MRDRRRVLALVVLLACVAAWGISSADSATGADEPGRQEVPPADGGVRPADRHATAMEPKPLSRPVRRGLEWLVESQLPGGGWGAGEGSGAVDLKTRSETPELTNTCIACLALIRSGSTPREGPYRGAIAQGVEYVCTQLETFDPESLDHDPFVRKTMVQRRYGPYLDTYLACVLLAEVKGHMSSSVSEDVVDRTLKKVIVQIERHVMQDDPFGFPAWTHALSDSVTKKTPMPPVPYDLAGWEWILPAATCGKGLHRARQAGEVVSDFALARLEDGARKAYKDLSGVALHIEPSNWVMVWRFAREIAQETFRQRARDGTLALDAGRSPSKAAEREAELVERRGRLPGARPAPPSPSAGEAARDGKSVDRETEVRAGKTAPPRSRTKGRTTTGRGAGGGLTMPHAVAPGEMLTIFKSGGAELYSRAATLGMLQDAVNTGRAEMPRLRDQAAHSKDPKELAAAEKSLARNAGSEKLQQEAQAAVVARLGHSGFLAGFGTNGGDEFLSYMMIAESLVAKGGDTWRRWDSLMTARLDRMQNGDGSWSGIHEVKGRTFCTAAALLTLMADRTPIPVPARAKASSFSSSG